MTPASHPLQKHINVLRGLVGLSLATYLPLSVAALVMFPPRPFSTATMTGFAAVAAACAILYWPVGFISRKATKSAVARLYVATVGRWFPAMRLGLVSFALTTFTADATAYLLGATASILTLVIGVWPRATV